MITTVSGWLIRTSGIVGKTTILRPSEAGRARAVAVSEPACRVCMTRENGLPTT